MTHDAIRIVGLDNPPVNALSQTLRASIVEQIRTANGDPSVAAIILIGTDRAFSSGADITEFADGSGFLSPTFAEMIHAVESSFKPIVAAISGFCLGAGFELALAAHARVAKPNAKLGLPEVNIGIIPGAGGTQRLPRAISATDAVEMIATGRARFARELEGTLLLDGVDDDIICTANRVASEIAAGRRERTLLREKTVDRDAIRSVVATARTKHSRPAALAALEAIEAAATMTFDEGIALEASLFKRLENSLEARALRHAFFAERSAGKLNGITVPGRPVCSVGIVGSGTMGRGIAISVIKAGIPTHIIDVNPSALATARKAVEGSFARDVGKGNLSEEQRDTAMSRLSFGTDLEGLVQVDLVIEAVSEDMSIKNEVFASLDRVCKPDALLASNTSMLNINEIASRTSDPSRVIGLHFFSPANVMRLLEVVNGDATSHQALATALAFAKQINKIAVVAGVCHGFIGNRMIEAYLDRAYGMLEDGMSPYEIDTALEEWGMAMGPFRMTDLAGNDVSHAAQVGRRKLFPDVYISPFAEIMNSAGRLGQKSAAGWYDYTTDAPKGAMSPKVDVLVADMAMRIGRNSRQYTRAEIVAEMIGTLASEGEKILLGGYASSASDIDVVYLHGYGFPRYRGGPMFAAANGLAL